MLLSLIIQSIQLFQSDCLALSERHYPTIHHRGFRAPHLALTFAYRLQHQLKHHTLVTQPVTQMTTNPDTFSTHYHHINTQIGNVWIITYNLLSARHASKQKLLQNMSHWLTQNITSINEKDYLVLISDHWINRSINSRQLRDWWVELKHDDFEDYRKQGIMLETSKAHFSALTKDYYASKPIYLDYAHPLKRKNNQEPIRKYLQLYAVFAYRDWSQNKLKSDLN